MSDTGKLEPMPDVILQVVPKGESTQDELYVKTRQLFEQKNRYNEQIAELDKQISAIQQKLGRYLPVTAQPLVTLGVQDERGGRPDVFDSIICPTCNNILLINTGGKYVCTRCQRVLVVWEYPWTFTWEVNCGE